MRTFILLFLLVCFSFKLAANTQFRFESISLGFTNLNPSNNDKNKAYNVVIEGNVTNIACPGNKNGAIDLTVSGGIPPYKYDWNIGSFAEDLTNLNGGIYTVIVTDASETTATGTFEVKEPLIIQHPQAYMGICNGGNLTPLKVALNQPSTETYQWYEAASATGSGTAISGATNSTYLPSITSIGKSYYYAGISIPGCPEYFSTKSEVSFASDPVITTQPLSETICYGGKYKPVLAAEGGAPKLTYQWQYSANGSTGWANVSNGSPVNASYSNPTSANLFSVSGNLAIGNYFYRCLVSSSGGGCDPVYSKAVNLAIVPSTKILQQPVLYQEVCKNSVTNVLKVSLNPGTYTYQWYSNAVNSNSCGTLISGAVNESYTPPSNTEGTTYYYCVINSIDFVCGPVSSTISTVKVNKAPEIITQPLSYAICQGETFQPGLKINDAININYQWQYSANGKTGWSNVSNNTPANAVYSSTVATNFKVTGNIASGTYYYRCVINSNFCSSIYSINAVLTVTQKPVIQKQPLNATIYKNQTYSPKIIVSTFPDLKYQWQFSANGTTGWANVANGTPANSVYSNANSASNFKVSGDIALGTYYFRCLVTGPTSCSNLTSKAASLNIIEIPKPTNDPIDTRSNQTDKLENKLSLVISPNPANDYINLSLENSKSELFDIYVFDAKGQMVIDLYKTKPENINISKLPSGIYYVKLAGNEGIVSGKFVK